MGPCGLRLVQVRLTTGLTSEEYVSQKGWLTARFERCPFHPEGGCGFASHGTYPRIDPPGCRIARGYCPTAHATVSLLPDFLCSRLTGTLAEVERVVAAVEVAPTQEAASEVLRPDIELPGGVRLARGHGDDAAADLHGRVLVSGRPVPELAVAVVAPRPERSVFLHRHRVILTRGNRSEAAADLDGGVLVSRRPVAELAGAVRPPRPERSVLLHRHGVPVARGHGGEAAADLNGRVLVSGRPVPELTVAVRPPRPERSVLLHRHRVTVSRRSGNEAAADLDGGILVRSGPVAELRRLRRTGRCGRGATTATASSGTERPLTSTLPCRSAAASPPSPPANTTRW